MYSLIIADDEEVIRRRLSEEINWAKYGFELLAVAADGVEAVELVLRHAPHLLIVDVQMPRMDGLEVMRRVRQGSPSTLVAILSAHSVFDYAREALKYDAVGYILKPIDEGQLNDVLQKVLGRLYERGARPRKRSEESDPVTLARDWAAEHFAEEITLEAVAAKCYVNASYLSSAFKARMECGFTEYITRLRVERAKKLLVSSGYKVRDIAFMVGFNDFGYFCRVFKKVTGKTPLEYKCGLG